jgi:TonB family protein
VLIPDRLRAEFGGRPEQRFFGQQVCITGQVRLAGRIAHIVLDSSAHVLVRDEKAVPRFGDGAHRPCGQGAVAPKPTKEVRPDYPSGDLVRRRIEGRLLLEALVGTDGAVSGVRTLYSEVREFEPSAEAALRQWRFEPGTLNGTVVPMIVQVEMSFVLR